MACDIKIMNTNKLNKRYIIVISVILFIWINSILPSNVSSEQSGFFTKILSSILDALKANYEPSRVSVFIRKLAHFTEFFLLGLSVMYAEHFKFNRKYILHIGIVVAFIDESIQFFVPGRNMATLDIFIDYCGYMLALGIVYLTKFIKEKNASN